MEDSSCVRATGWPRRSRCRGRSATGRRRPVRRSGCRARRPAVRHTAAVPPPGVCRGTARRSSRPRRESARRSGCTGWPRAAPSGASCFGRGRYGAWRPHWRRRRACRRPCRQHSWPGRPRGASPGTARRKRGRGRPAPCRTGCRDPVRCASPSRGGTACARRRVPCRDRAAACLPPGAVHRERGSPCCACRYTGRTRCAPAREVRLRTADKDLVQRVLRRAGGSVRGRACGGFPDPCRPSAPSIGVGMGTADARPAARRPDVREWRRQPFCLRSQSNPVETEPQYCTPPRVRSPVQTMISVRAGRIASTAFRGAVA